MSFNIFIPSTSFHKHTANFFFMLSLGRAWSRPPYFLLFAITFSTSFWPGHLSCAINLFLISSFSAGVHFFLVRLFCFFLLTDFFSETIFHIIRLIKMVEKSLSNTIYQLQFIILRQAHRLNSHLIMQHASLVTSYNRC